MLIEDEERSAMDRESFVGEFQTMATEANDNPGQEGRAGN